jgi:hypothetical protein
MIKINIKKFKLTNMIEGVVFFRSTITLSSFKIDSNLYIVLDGLDAFPQKKRWARCCCVFWKCIFFGGGEVYNN